MGAMRFGLCCRGWEIRRRFQSTVCRTFSGIQPTGTPHLGNYLGAIQTWVKELDSEEGKSEKIFSIVDLHAITIPSDPWKLRENIFSVAAGLFSSGLSPEKCILFQQSRVPEHSELCWILSSVSTVQTLLRLSQYKDKCKTLKEPSPALLMYPVLQSADILLYKATKIPIGEDNVQNLEVARALCRNFNRIYDCSFFHEPIPILSFSSKIKSLRNPQKKMSKSDIDTKSCIYINDPPDVIIEKCKKAVTDSQSRLSYEPDTRPGVSNLILIHSALTGDSIDCILSQNSRKDTGTYKKVLAEIVIEKLKPIRIKHDYYMSNKDYLHVALEKGYVAAKEIASQTMSDVRSIVGFR